MGDPSRFLVGNEARASACGLLGESHGGRELLGESHDGREPARREPRLVRDARREQRGLEATGVLSRPACGVSWCFGGFALVCG